MAGGRWARLIESIPVERVDDVAFDGAGLVCVPEDGEPTAVLGRGTNFTKEVSTPAGLRGVALL